ncbi:hypothetical protein [Paenibacillus monticola]|uniref:GAF domain-containing protein n=1 Tax=Paenibacillus monticola TaxID=2666075 RepID=A0A7X2H349_9BACL|nr:hypothetical protein [Paenibacillus monticola]MRN52631.1 hypothetical protein [Paenibacillus monticola]
MNDDPVFYRFESLILAIDFFTQRFSQEQLAEFSFEFVNEILTLNESALFIRKDKKFILSKKRLYTYDEYEVDDTEQLNHLVTHHGNCLWSDFAFYLEQQVIEDFQIGLLIPLMIDSQLYGFIISSGKIIGEILHDDKIIASTLMRLINNSMENSKHFIDLQQSNALLDQKIFNLFTINQSSKALLSELNLTKLHALATDVFSELSMSQVTSFGLYDSQIGKIKIVGYRNVTSFTSLYIELELRETQYDGPVVLHIQQDAALINKYFVDGGQFHRLEAQYIVLIVGNRQIMGLVTLGASVQGKPYDASLFEVIESLATSTYIAVNNSMLFEELDWQKKNAQNKLDMLINLNKLTKNIKHCTTLEDLCYLTLKTMKFAFGIRKAFICFRKRGRLEIVDSIGMGDNLRSMDLPAKLVEACREGETQYGFTADSLALLCGEPLPEDWGDSNGFVISPLSFSNQRHGDQVVSVEPDGVLIVLETEALLKEEEILLIDSIAANISPVAHHIHEAAALRQAYIEDPQQLFLSALQVKIDEHHKDQLDFYAYWCKFTKHPFQPLRVPEELENAEVFYLDGYLFVLSYSPVTLSSLNPIDNRYDVSQLLNEFNGFMQTRVDSEILSSLQ